MLVLTKCSLSQSSLYLKDHPEYYKPSFRPFFCKTNFTRQFTQFTEISKLRILKLRSNIIISKYLDYICNKIEKNYNLTKTNNN